MEITVLFQRGNFDTAATIMVSEALFFITLSLIPYMARDTITRVFYAFDDSRTPFVVAICSVAVKVLMNAIFVKSYGVSGIMISTTMVTLFNAIVLGCLILRKKINLDYKGFLIPLAKMMLAAGLTGGLCVWLNNLIMSFYNQPTWLFLFIKLYHKI